MISRSRRRISKKPDPIFSTPGDFPPPAKMLPKTIVLFPSDLGWFALAFRGALLAELTFNHPNSETALRHLRTVDAPDDLQIFPRIGDVKILALVEKLRAYAAGEKVDFSRVPLDLAAYSPFQKRALMACRERVPFGQMLSYGKLAEIAGSPRAARAVGSAMAANRIPIVIPCHRIIPANKKLGKYSAPDGPRMKFRLLTLEQKTSPQLSYSL